MATRIRGIREEDVSPLVGLAKESGHDLWLPSHVIEKDGELIGSFGIDTVPFVTGFVSSEINSPITLRAINKRLELQMREWGETQYFIAVGEKSPVYRFMQAGGYTGYNTTLWHREVK